MLEGQTQQTRSFQVSYAFVRLACCECIFAAQPCVLVYLPLPCCLWIAVSLSSLGETTAARLCLVKNKFEAVAAELHAVTVKLKELHRTWAAGEQLTGMQ